MMFVRAADLCEHVAPGVEYQGTTVQLCGLYPFMAGSGAPVAISAQDPLAIVEVGICPV